MAEEDIHHLGCSWNTHRVWGIAHLSLWQRQRKPPTPASGSGLVESVQVSHPPVQVRCPVRRRGS